METVFVILFSVKTYHKKIFVITNGWINSVRKISLTMRAMAFYRIENSFPHYTLQGKFWTFEWLLLKGKSCSLLKFRTSICHLVDIQRSFVERMDGWMCGWEKCDNIFKKAWCMWQESNQVFQVKKQHQRSRGHIAGRIDVICVRSREIN